MGCLFVICVYLTVRFACLLLFVGGFIVVSFGYCLLFLCIVIYCVDLVGLCD